MLGEVAVNQLIQDNTLVTYTRQDRILITRASLLKALGE